MTFLDMLAFALGWLSTDVVAFMYIPGIAEAAPKSSDVSNVARIVRSRSLDSLSVAVRIALDVNDAKGH